MGTGCTVSLSERDDRGEEARRRGATSQRPTKLNGVELEVFCKGRLGIVGECPARRTAEFEQERTVVATGPFTDDVGDDSTIVIRSYNQFTVDSAGGVYSVHPHVA